MIIDDEKPHASFWLQMALTCVPFVVVLPLPAEGVLHVSMKLNKRFITVYQNVLKFVLLH